MVKEWINLCFLQNRTRFSYHLLATGKKKVVIYSQLYNKFLQYKINMLHSQYTNTTGICIESNTMCYYMQGELYETFFTRPSTMCHLPNMITLNCWLPKEAVLSRSSSR